MFEHLAPQAPDKIIALMQQFRADPRDNKIDLGVGVYRNAEGVTPVMRAVRTAAQRVQEAETTKAYTALVGDMAFLDAMIDLVLGDSVPRDSVAAAATPGGTGAIRNALELIRLANPNVRVFLSDPTWPNHPAIIDYLGIERVSYRYFDSESRSVDFDGMMEDLKGLRAGDVILLHGCCHNPTGANLNPVEWQAVIDHIVAVGAMPLIDIAYQGFGDGLDEDAAAVRKVAASVPDCLIAASCSKNFGVYRERTGLLMAVSSDPAKRARAQDTMTALNRLNYSFPPDHGARLVSTILTDAELRADWAAELEDVRLSMLNLRQQLAAELQRVTGSDRFAFLAQHRGMFSRLGTTPELVEKLRADYGIYMIGDSRMNIAGLNAQSVPILANAIAEVGV
ncbi:MAG: aromatic amino acid transaminase [Paracoccaceae bacterium]